MAMNIRLHHPQHIGTVQQAGTAAPPPAPVEKTGMAAFEARAGMPLAARAPLRLGERLAQQARLRRRHAGGESAAAGDATADLEGAAGDGQDDGDAPLQGGDPRRRNAQTARTRRQSSDHELSADAELDGMVHERERQRGPALADGQHNSEAFSDTLDQGGAPDGQDLQQGLQTVRERYGAPRDAPATPDRLFAALLASAGPGGLTQALQALRARFGASLRDRKTAGPRLWLALGDAGSFNVVQTCASLAGELRSSIAEHARVAPALDQTALTGLLLDGARLRDEGAAHLLDRLCPLPPEDHRGRAQAALALRATVERLPPAVWRAASGARQSLLADLRALVVQAHGRLPPPRDPAADTEAALRAAWATTTPHHSETTWNSN